MILVIVVLLIIVAILLYKIIIDRRNTIYLTEQIKLALHKNERFDLKVSSNNKEQNELIEQINILNTNWREMSANYSRYTLQNKEMISSITHDFRTPLTSMLGYVQILQDLPEQETQLKYLKTIEDRTKSLTKLVDDFYEISILDSEEYPVTIQKLNPKVILQEQLAMYYEDITTHFKNVNIDIDDTVVFANSDNKALTRIYSNLIKNALTHGIDNFEVLTTIQDNNLIIIFKNSIKEKEHINIERLFDRTFRNDSTRNVNSTGLGLSITKELSSIINSKISVKQVDQDIYFELIIPII